MKKIRSILLFLVLKKLNAAKNQKHADYLEYLQIKTKTIHIHKSFKGRDPHLPGP